MRKRDVQPKAKTGKAASSRRTTQRVTPKRPTSGVSGRAIGECKTYVTEQHYEL